jgi:hypothetical protein
MRETRARPILWRVVPSRPLLIGFPARSMCGLAAFVSFCARAKPRRRGLETGGNYRTSTRAITPARTSEAINSLINTRGPTNAPRSSAHRSIISRQGRFDRRPTGAAADVLCAACCCGGVCRGGAAVACVCRAALCAAALEKAATAGSPREASILPPQLKQFAEASGFSVPQRVQYISIPKINEDKAVDQRRAKTNHISVHKRATGETDVVRVFS